MYLLIHLDPGGTGALVHLPPTAQPNLGHVLLGVPQGGGVMLHVLGELGALSFFKVSLLKYLGDG